MKSKDLIRNFGVIPAAQPIPVGKVRSEMRLRTIIGQWIATILFGGFMFLGGLIPLLVAALADVELSKRLILMAVGVVFSGGFVLVIRLITHDNHWVELDGDTLRACNLYSRKITERPVREINDIRTDVMAIRGLTVRIVEGIQGRVRGFSIRFHDLPEGIKLVQPEMTNVFQLVAAIYSRMGEYGELAPEIITFEGKPLVRRVTWADRLPSGQSTARPA